MNADQEADLEPGAPYLREHGPRSIGRVLLSRALEEYAAVEWGFSPEDIAATFRGGETRHRDAASVRACLRNAADNFVDLLLSGDLTSFARPHGGGKPEPMESWLWEIDDPMPRFATSAFDPQRPFDASARPTHWILLDEAGVADLIQALCGGPPPKRRRAAAEKRSSVAVDEPRSDGFTVVPDAEGLLRLPEVERLTGMSRSTIYAKISQRDFPEPIRLGSRFSRWRRTDVQDWLTRLS